MFSGVKNSFSLGDISRYGPLTKIILVHANCNIIVTPHLVIPLPKL